MKSHEKESIHHILCIATFLHLRMRPKIHCFWSAIRRLAVEIQAGQNFESNPSEKTDFVIFNDCQDMIQNVDVIITPSFSAIRVSNQRLINIKVGLF